MIRSVFKSEGVSERLLTRASNHRSQLEDLRCEYLSEMRRGADEQPLPEYVRNQCRNVSLALEGAQRQLGRLEELIERAEAAEAQIELEAAHVSHD